MPLVREADGVRIAQQFRVCVKIQAPSRGSVSTRSVELSLARRFNAGEESQTLLARRVSDG